MAAGLQRTGGVITSLALLLIIVIGAFSASGITFIKLMGVGMIVALLVDATGPQAEGGGRRLAGRYSSQAARDWMAAIRSLPEENDVNQPGTVPEVLSADLPAGVFLLDVREDDEWTAGHAPDAVHVRLGEVGARVDELPRDREVYVICRSGTRSAYATQALTAGGLNAINVADGMTGWAVAGRPMISEDGSEPHVA